MQKTYSFNRNDFQAESGSKSTKREFYLLVEKWQYDFYNTFKPFKANYFISNLRTMMLYEHSFYLEANERFGMELINNEINIEANFEMDKYSVLKTVYALGSYIEGDADKPVYLVIDDRIPDNKVLLKYINDNDSGNEQEPVGALDCPEGWNKRVKA